MKKRVLITAGGTREPIDAVRYIGNRSSGRMGAAIAMAALEAGHAVTVIAGQVSVEFPVEARWIGVETTRDMHEAVLAEWPTHDAIVMAAAVADYRPTIVATGKLRRGDGLTLELEPTEDILAAVGRAKRSDQIVVGFSLDENTDAARDRARDKLVKKGCDLLVFNPLATMDASDIAATLYWRDGRSRVIELSDKAAFARELVGLL